MIYLMKKYESKNSYYTPWGSFPCTIENGLAILSVSNTNMTKYLINRYGFKLYRGYAPTKVEDSSIRGSNGRFTKKVTPKKSTKKSTKKKTSSK